jgi:hypothetical protein
MSLPTAIPTSSLARTRSGVVALFAGAALTLSACGGDSGADPASTQSRVNSSIPRVVDNVAASMGLLAGSETLAALGQSFDSIGQTFGFLDTGDDFGNFRLMFDGHGDDFFDDEMSGEEIAQFLAERIFTDENYEGDGYYRVPDDLLCVDTFTGEINQTCAEELEAVQLRVRAVLAGADGVDISIVIGPSRVAPVMFELRPDSLAVVVDLGDLRAAAVFLADLAGEVLEDVPDVLEGVVALAVIVHGDEHVSLEAAVREAITIEGDGVSVSLAARDPMFALEIDVPEESVTASVDIGPLNVKGPWAEMDEDSLATGEGELSLQGFSADITLQEGAKTLQIENISLGAGTSTLSLDGHVLLAVDFNADSGRAFTLTVLPEEGELPTFGFDPEFDLSLAFDLQPLADAGDEVPDFLLGETVRVAITGDQPTIQPVEAQGEFPGGIRVVSGELLLSSTGADREIVVAAGSCLIASEPEEEDHPFIGAFDAASCE